MCETCRGQEALPLDRAVVGNAVVGNYDRYNFWVERSPTII